MKRVVVLLLCIALLCGCSAQNQKSSDSTKLNIVTSIFPLYDFVRAVGGDRVDITLLIDPGTEVHSYEPAPSDIAAVYNADLFLYIGGESDKWALKILADVNVDSLALLSTVKLLEEGNHSGQDRIEDNTHEHEYDEHIWTFPDNAVIMIEKIKDTLCEINSVNEEYYNENCKAYTDEIRSISDDIRTVVSESDRFILMADRFPFKYFAEGYGINYKAAFGGCASSSDISLKTMTELVRAYKDNNCKAAFYCELSNKTVANALAEETGAELYELHSAHNVSKDDFEKGITYADIMRRNAEALRKGLR